MIMTDRKLEEAGKIPGLSYPELAEARDALFGDRTGVPYGEFLDRTQESYQPINLEEYARAQNFVDALRLVQFMSEMRQNAERLMTPGERGNNLLMLGCGQGRLMEVYVPAARLLGIESITFNDLIPKHIEQTRAKAKHLYGRKMGAAGVKLDFDTGDFLTSQFRQRYDHIVSFWYVSAELLNPESAQALRKHRSAIYRKIHQTLVPNGTLFEDIPDPNQPGYYDIGTHVTTLVLEEKGLLFDEHKNVLLSNWRHEQGSSGFPYQLRYVPRNGTDQREKQEAGFCYVRTDHENVPTSAIIGANVVQSALEERGAKISTALRTLRQLQNTNGAVTFPESDDPAAKRRKMTLWRAEDSD
jgi:2-polyprenyl-3-methyl-5-hydroxy-6-metoxy-1,4-benzoquinol methylase